MLRYQNQAWSQFDPKTFTLDPRFQDPLGSVYEDMEFLGCKVEGGGLGERARRPEDRTIVRRVRASKCSVRADVGPVLFEDVHVSDLRTGDGLLIWGALFKHVTLTGRIGSIVLNSRRWPIPDEDEQRAFSASAAEFYASVDWALDISRAQFTSLDWRLDVPSRLVRRDPETQVVIKRERAIEERWRKVPLHMIVSIALENFVQFGQSEMILAASKASKRFKDELESIEALRKEGIAEPE